MLRTSSAKFATQDHLIVCIVKRTISRVYLLREYGELRRKSSANSLKHGTSSKIFLKFFGIRLTNELYQDAVAGESLHLLPFLLWSGFGFVLSNSRKPREGLR